MAVLIRKPGDRATLPSKIVIEDEQRYDPDARSRAALDLALARRIAAKLMLHYPGHPWTVTVQGKQGVAVIKHHMLATNYGYVIKLRDLNGDPSLKLVVKAGGEILERFNLARGRHLDLHQTRAARPAFDDVKMVGRDAAKYAPPRLILPPHYPPRPAQ